MPIPESGCWVWMGTISSHGYARIWIGYKSLYVHRLSYEIHKGEIGKNLTIDHLCRVRCCVNPEHLEAVSNKENILRGEGITAKNVYKTHCPKGHLYSGDNLYVYRGYRYCRICQKQHATDNRGKYN